MAEIWRYANIDYSTLKPHTRFAKKVSGDEIPDERLTDDSTLKPHTEFAELPRSKRGKQ
jgi:hypothetical protein